MKIRFVYPKEYAIWANMKSRCHNKQDKNYPNYGGRGVKVCDRWLSFNNFIKDMKAKPASDSTLDRINNDGNYEPLNCRWVNRTIQANNRRDNNLIVLWGKKYTVAEAAKRFDLGYFHLWQRIKRGWEPHDAVLTP